MKANELRIGNYFNVPNPNQSPFRIDCIEYLSENDGKVGKYVAGHEDKHPLTWYLEDLQPIPLTEEWLLKFGLEERYVKGEWSWANCKNGDTKWSSYTEISNTKNSGATIGYIYNRDYPEIIYVHQLQNLYYALTGEELTIKQ